jgi:hypothetical protein
MLLAITRRSSSTASGRASPKVQRATGSDPLRGVALPERTPRVEQHLEMGIVQDPNQVSSLWEWLVATAQWSGEPLWLQGIPTPEMS